MVLFTQFLDKLLALWVSSSLAQVTVYDWDGEQPQDERVAFVDMCGGAFNLAVGAESLFHGWVDLRKSGSAYCDVIMTTYSGSGVRDIEINIDYGELIGGSMNVTTTQQERSTEPLTYGPMTGSHRVMLDRIYGNYARVRKIKNDGDSIVAIQVRGKPTLKPLPTTNTLDRNVEVI